MSQFGYITAITRRHFHMRIPPAGAEVVATCDLHYPQMVPSGTVGIVFTPEPPSPDSATRQTSNTFDKIPVYDTAKAEDDPSEEQDPGRDLWVEWRGFEELGAVIVRLHQIEEDAETQ